VSNLRSSYLFQADALVHDPGMHTVQCNAADTHWWGFLVAVMVLQDHNQFDPLQPWHESSIDTNRIEEEKRSSGSSPQSCVPLLSRRCLHCRQRTPSLMVRRLEGEGGAVRATRAARPPYPCRLGPPQPAGTPAAPRFAARRPAPAPIAVRRWMSVVRAGGCCWRVAKLPGAPCRTSEAATAFPVSVFCPKAAEEWHRGREGW